MIRLTNTLLLLCCLSLMNILLPAPVRAQQILAAVIAADLPRFRHAHEAMLTVLEAGGFGEDRLRIFTQTPNSDKMSLINSVRRAKASGAELVITYGSRATAAAQQELKGTPLLFADVYDPVALGVVKNLAAPGADATGVTSKTNLKTLVEAVQKFRATSQVGVLYTKGEPGAEQQLEEMEELAVTHGFAVLAESARNPKEALRLAEKLSESCDMLYLTESLAVGQQAETIVKAIGKKCLVFSQIPGLAASGAAAGLEAEPAEQGKLLAVQALQVLQGQKAFILPVRPAKKINLVINRSAVIALGLSVPSDLDVGFTLVD